MQGMRHVISTMFRDYSSIAGMRLVYGHEWQIVIDTSRR